MKITRLLHKYKHYLLIFIALIHLVNILNVQRENIFQKYDSVYWQDRFEHSQWQLPLSKRIIGDDGLFSFVGYKLTNGMDPSSINAETPPVGKYLLGYSIALFKNPVYISLFMGIGSLILFYLIATRILKNKTYALFTTLLLFLDPLFFSQFWHAWLDMPQLFFLLANILLLLSLTSKHGKINTFLVLGSGLMLGFFSQTKPAVLLPGILLIEVLYLYKNRYLKQLIPYFIGVAAAVLVSYLKFFMLSNSLFDFVRLQKYILNFYTQSQLEVNHSTLTQILLIGKFPDLVSSQLSNVEEWSLLWPLLALTGIISSIYCLVNNKFPLIHKGISLYILYTVIIYSLIPTYTRYLLVLLPFLLLLSVLLIDKIKQAKIKFVIGLIVVIYSITNAYVYLIPSADPLLKTFTHNISNQFFQDIYQENITKTDKNSYQKENFRLLTQGTLEDAQITHISVTEVSRQIPKLGNKGNVQLQITYHTRHLGSFTEEKPVRLVKENGKWKVSWDWNIVLSGYQPGYKTITTIKPGARGSIIDESENILAEDREGFLISINPDELDTTREESLLILISKLSFGVPIQLQNAYLENALPNTYIPLVTNFIPLTKEYRTKLSNYPGVRLTPYHTRIYYEINPKTIANTVYSDPSTRIYSSYSYHGISGPEQQYDNILSGHDGGTVTMANKEGKIVRTILSVPSFNGRNVTLGN